MISNKSRKLFRSVLLALLSLVIAGCVMDDSLDSYRLTGITLTPVDLFEGDKAKFKLLLGMSGGFKLRYSGDKPNVRLAISKWEDGKKIETLGVLSDVFFVPEGKQQIREVEVIASIDSVTYSEQDPFFIVKVAIWRNESSSAMVSFKVPWNETLLGQSEIQHQEPITFAMEGSVPVWGMQGMSSGKPFRYHDLSEESLSEMEWALIVSLELDGENLRSN